MTALDSSNEKGQPQSLEFNSLPQEIRDLIWEFALPGRRLFHVKGAFRQRPIEDPNKRDMFFRFHIHHPPPVTSYINKESRAVAMRKGFFLSSYADRPGVWFNPSLDILYFDRNQRTSFHLRPGESRMSLPGWDRVLNVGLEWRAFFRDTPRPVQEETTADYWWAAIYSLYLYMPNMKTLNYILPKVRHKGGITWGREPYGAQEFDAGIVPLPAATQIPWGSERNTGNGQVTRGTMHGEMARRTGLSAQMVTWREVKSDMEKGFEERMVDEEDADDRRWEYKEATKEEDERGSRSPRILGWWLVRVGAPSTYENPQVMEFHA
ncbi:Fc.00g096820.m01.CDS01 [Cosmosporella sp. VM-42]